VLPVEQYAEILFAQGAESLTVYEKVYPHVMENADSVVEWTSGTLLVPYFERLGDMKDPFLDAYRRRLREKMPGSPVFYGFRRILFSAAKPA
jgi:trans-aconitate 2-methyltransferase